jgi:hypothetical protein
MTERLEEERHPILNPGETPDQARSRLELAYLMSGDAGFQGEVERDLDQLDVEFPPEEQ